MNMKNDFTTTKKWREKRKKILQRDKYLDQVLLRQGIYRNATIVHHILPRDQFPQYAYADWNLTSVTLETHTKLLHNSFTGELTKLGKRLMIETAYKNGVKLKSMILVIGLPESGKTTYVKENLNDGLAYDLDYISAAFRLRRPKEEEHESSRIMANRLLKGFIVEAPKYNSEVFIIRTAPYEKELYDINPDKLVICDGGYRKRLDTKYDIDIDECLARIKFCEDYCLANNIEVEHYKKGE